MLAYEWILWYMTCGQVTHLSRHHLEATSGPAARHLGQVTSGRKPEGLRCHVPQAMSTS